MPAKTIHKDEQIRLIMECRSSGLSDYEWCRQNNIKPGTFYNWVRRLKQAKGLTFPRKGQEDDTPVCRQEVVKLDMLHAPAPISSINDGYNDSVAISDHYVASKSQNLKVNLAYGSVEIPNGTDPALLEATFRILGGVYAR